jgi:DNA-binding SARP family transcriptional activator/class 3 adenylate cyclase/ABC-type glycerol-3-phosphate transport system substrate-binding protein
MESPPGPREPSRANQPASVIRTFLIADLRGYTRFSDSRGDEAAAALAERFVAVATEGIESRTGTIVEVRGDEILAVFDSAREAIRAALDLQSALASDETADVPLGVGIGIDAGEAVPLGAGYRGRALNLAARLCARARPGEILVTSELVHLAGAVEDVRFEDRGSVRLKGISRPVDLLAVVRPTPSGQEPLRADPIAGHLEFRLLGPLEVTDGGRVVTLGGPRQRLVLAHLLLAANRIVTMEELIERVWDEEPPHAARNTIQSYVSHLRAALGPDRIEGRTPGYVLQAEPDELDVLRFEQLLRRSRRQLATEPREAAATIDEALELWRGSPLSDLADAPSLVGEIARLEELRTNAVEDLFAARLAVGDHAEVLPDLERLVAEHPLRERFWNHLVLARYRSGRQADALEGYRRAQEILAEELGIDPSPELQDLHRRILRQDPTLQLTGTPLRGYRLLERVGEGAFGVVWRSLDPQLGREVGIKQIHPRLADDPSFVRRFEQEAQTIARIEHPHVVPLYDYWRDGSGAYLVMRWMRGGNLEEALARGSLDPEHAVRVVDQLAAALSAAHRGHTVHRDVKPANVLLDDDGNAYLSDFGIAEDLTDWREVVPPASLGYYSPEQLRGEEVTPASDIYGLGMVVQDVVDGRHGDARVADVISRATADDPDSRYRDAGEVAVALRDALDLPVPRPRTVDGETEERNPYKGLHAFAEADADDFFGRDALVDRLVARMAESADGSRFLAVVGPSGSGKSSVVRAGLIPTLRAGGLPGSDGWFYVEMLPGAHPMEELEAALQRIALDPPHDMLDLLERSERGLVRLVDRLLPDDGSELVLVVDQLEEVFTMVEDEPTRDRFLESLVAATQERGSRLRVIVTLRADFYDRPLSFPGLAELMRTRMETVVPLTAEEIERAIGGPAARVGVVPELALVAEMVADVSDRPGALPLLQYALTELFERRRGRALTLEAYRAIGGVSGALARRAEELYEAMSEEGREATKQLFLRLVIPGDGPSDTRRLVSRAELLSIQLDRRAMEGVIDTFGRHRLLAFDRDPATRGPTVEVAHEALLRSWDRLRMWIDLYRDDLDRHRRITAAARDWEASAEDPGLLLRGRRLDDLRAWEASTDLALSHEEQEYLAASVRNHDRELEEGEARAERERTLERRSVARLRALVAVLTVAVLVAAGLTTIATNRAGEAERLRNQGRIAALTGSSLTNLDANPDRSVLLALHAVNVSASRGDAVSSETVEALHWAMQEAGVPYPTSEGDEVAVVAGPFGTRGVFDLPVGALAQAARSHVPRDLTASECHTYFESDTCPSLPTSFSRDLPFEGVREVKPPPGKPVVALPPLTGTRVTLHWNLHNNPRSFEPFQRELDAFTDRTGIAVDFVNFSDQQGWITAEQAAADPPDLAFMIPGVGADLARRGYLVDMTAFVDTNQLVADQSPYMVSLGTLGRGGDWPADDGMLFAAFAQVNVKSLIWYPIPELRNASSSLPSTWEELVGLSRRLQERGTSPWCMGWESEDADGWAGTDWIENLVLAGEGLETYDAWSFHELPFDSPPIRRAFERLGRIVFTDGSVLGGPRSVVERGFWEAQHPMLQDPPDCSLYLQATFAAGFIPPGNVGRSTDVFPFPPMAGQAGGVIGGGEMVGTLSDRPEVRKLVQFLLSPAHGVELAKVGHEYMSPNQRFDLDIYPNEFWRRQAELAKAALAADRFRFDASDLMPRPIGDDLFWAAMMQYVREGPDSLDEVLSELDAAWPDDTS